MSGFVDANIFIRLLMQDDLAKAQKCRDLRLSRGVDEAGGGPA
jgi:hypothetical protein